MWHLGRWFHVGLGSAGLMPGHDGLKAPIKMILIPFLRTGCLSVRFFVILMSFFPNPFPKAKYMQKLQLVPSQNNVVIGTGYFALDSAAMRR